MAISTQQMIAIAISTMLLLVGLAWISPRSMPSWLATQTTTTPTVNMTSARPLAWESPTLLAATLDARLLYTDEGHDPLSAISLRFPAHATAPNISELLALIAAHQFPQSCEGARFFRIYWDFGTGSVLRTNARALAAAVIMVRSQCLSTQHPRVHKR